MSAYVSKESGKSFLRLLMQPTNSSSFLMEIFAYSETDNGGGGGPIIYRAIPTIFSGPLVAVSRDNGWTPPPDTVVYNNFAVPPSKIPAGTSFAVPISYRWAAPSKDEAMVSSSEGSVHIIATSSAPHLWGAHVVWEER